MCSYFLGSSIHRQLAAIGHLEQCARLKKRWPQLLDRPHFAFQCSSPVTNQCKFSKCYTSGATLRFGMTLAHIFASWGYTKISPNNASTVIIKKLGQSWILLKKVMNSSLPPPWHPSEPPKFHCPTPPNRVNAAGQQALIILFFIKNCPWDRVFQIQPIRLYGRL